MLPSGSPGPDVWSTFSTSRDAPAAAALDAFGADPFGAAPAPSAAGINLFGAAPAAASRPATSPVAPPSADPFASDFGGSSFGATTAGAGSSTVSDPFGVSASHSKGTIPAPATPPSRALPEDMFAAPSSPVFGRVGLGVPPQQAAPFGHMPPAFAQPGFGAFGGAQGGAFPAQAGAFPPHTGGFPPQAGSFPPRPPAGGPFGVPQQPGVFGGQGMQSGFGGQQAAFGGASDPFGSDSGFGASFAQVQCLNCADAMLACCFPDASTLGTWQCCMCRYLQCFCTACVQASIYGQNRWGSCQIVAEDAQSTATGRFCCSEVQQLVHLQQSA